MKRYKRVVKYRKSFIEGGWHCGTLDNMQVVKNTFWLTIPVVGNVIWFALWLVAMMDRRVEYEEK